MKRITLHWDVGNGEVNDLVWQHYHFAIPSTNPTFLANPHSPPEVNNSQGVSSGRYLRHTGGGNTDNIGVAVLGMAGTTAHEARPFDAGPHKITDHQMEVAAKGVAELCVTYDISVTPETVFLHCEFDSKRGSKSTGKWDVSVWGTMPEPIDFKRAGDLWRAMVKKYIKPEAETPDAVDDLIAEAKDTWWSSKTNLSAIGAAALGLFETVTDDPQLTALFLVLTFGLVAYIIYSRQRKASKALKAEKQR